MKPTKQDIIEYLQNQIQHNRISMDELGKECKQHDIDLFDDVLFPIGYNLCDRCGKYGDSELGLLWVDGLGNEDDDNTLLNGIAKEGVDYCALCWDCVKELRKGE